LCNTTLLLAVTVVSPHMGAEGWPFATVDNFPGAEADPLYNSKHVKDLYFKADPDYSGRYKLIHKDDLDHG
jgi:glutathionyl-hydroquinone reductase